MGGREKLAGGLATTQEVGAGWTSWHQPVPIIIGIPNGQRQSPNVNRGKLTERIFAGFYDSTPQYFIAASAHTPAADSMRFIDTFSISACAVSLLGP